eukprot:758323-Hanusia_phi.AAC.2
MATSVEGDGESSEKRRGRAEGGGVGESGKREKTREGESAGEWVREDSGEVKVGSKGWRGMKEQERQRARMGRWKKVSAVL